MIRAKISMGAKKHSDGYKVDAMGAKGICGSQKAIKVVRPDVVANNGYNRNPSICFYPELLSKGPRKLFCWHRRKKHVY